MNEIREIVTRAVVAKGKKIFNLVENVKTIEKPYSILGCWIINHEFEASRVNEVVNLDGEFEVNIWYSTNNNSKTDIIREIISYKKDITTKSVVKNYLENTDDILARIIQHPTVTNAKIIDGVVSLEITFEIVAEIIGETKMKVTVFKEEENWEEEIDMLDMDINEKFLG